MAGRLSRGDWSHAVEKLWSLGDRPGSKSQLHHLLAGGPGASSLTSLSLGFLLHRMEIIQAPTSNDLCEHSARQCTLITNQNLKRSTRSVGASNVPLASLRCGVKGRLRPSGRRADIHQALVGARSCAKCFTRIIASFNSYSKTMTQELLLCQNVCDSRSQFSQLKVDWTMRKMDFPLRVRCVLVDCPSRH